MPWMPTANRTLLGSVAITIDNRENNGPFGNIDFPLPGQVLSGKSLNVTGWALTGKTAALPGDGSAIEVFIDSIPIGKAVYGEHRSDIEARFRGYANSSNAGGSFQLDTTRFGNGVHSLQWVVTDNRGNTEGVGMRFLTVQNNGPNIMIPSEDDGGRVIKNLRVDIEFYRPVHMVKGYGTHLPTSEHFPDSHGNVQVAAKELEAVQIFLGDGPGESERSSAVYTGYLRVGNEYRPLPAGSSLDTAKGIFSWVPGPGMNDTYHLVFVEQWPDGKAKQKRVTVAVRPKFEKQPTIGN